MKEGKFKYSDYPFYINVSSQNISPVSTGKFDKTDKIDK